ncbi:MAG: GDP-mannose 4,6-dehydratase [Terriglobales bacterium]
MKKPDPSRSVLIFGGAGFIGSNWAHHLLTSTDADVHVFDNLSRPGAEHNLQWLQKTAKQTGFLKITVADIRDVHAVRKAVLSAREIYHFAAQVAVTTSVEDPRTDFDINAAGTFNVLEAARGSSNHPFFLFTSTNKVYGHLNLVRTPSIGALRHECSQEDAISESQPLDFYSPYGCSKGSADQYVHDYARVFGLPTVVFRMSCVAGPRQFGNEDQGWVAHFLYSALQERQISIYGDGRQVRDVLAVQDLLRAFEAVYRNREITAGQIYNVGGGVNNAISLLELIDAIEMLLHKRTRHSFRPSRPGDQLVYISDFTKLQRHVGWSPCVPVRQIIEDIGDWWKQNRALFAPSVLSMPPVSESACDVVPEGAP